jgi:hypothetical protein
MRSKRQPLAAGGNGAALVQAIFPRSATRTFATRCAPLCSITVPSQSAQNGRFRLRQRPRGWRSTDPFSCKRGRAWRARVERARSLRWAERSHGKRQQFGPSFSQRGRVPASHCVRGHTRDVDGRRRWVHAQASDELRDLVRKQSGRALEHVGDELADGYFGTKRPSREPSSSHGTCLGTTP